MILSGDVDYKGSDVCGVSCIAPGDIGRRETIHVPTGPSSLDKINLVENAGECNADFVNKMPPPSGSKGHANLLCIVPILVYVPPKRVRLH